MDKKRRERIKATLSKQYNNRCAYCGRNLDVGFTLDHVLPKSKGGTLALSNLMPSCETCNKIKSSLDIEEFRAQIERLAKKQLNYDLLNRYYKVEIEYKPIVFYFERQKFTLLQHVQYLIARYL